MERKSRPLRGEEEPLTKEYLKKSELFKTVIKLPKRPSFFFLPFHRITQLPHYDFSFFFFFFF
jgi:hypothetical protein